MQIVASIRRLDYTAIVQSRQISDNRADPLSPYFDPERAAMLHKRRGNLEEAAWLIFLSVHFGQHGVHKWKRVADVYSGLGDGIWSWQRVSGNPSEFRAWLAARWQEVGGAFGNHRQYESLNPAASGGTAHIVESYAAWLGPSRSHEALFAALIRAGGNDPHGIFDHFYKSMQVKRFGRLGKFDFLCMLGRLGLAPIEPGSPYLQGATGPLRGARLLFANNVDAKIRATVLNEWVKELDGELNVGMQVMEDALCNWQKSPTQFVHFRG